MKRQEIALEFVRRFCAGDVAGLEELLHEQFRFRGPFLEVDSRAAYLEALAADPPEPAEFEVLSTTESGEEVALFYEYRKPAHRAVMAQLCRLRAGKIAEMVLVFDSRAFA